MEPASGKFPFIMKKHFFAVAAAALDLTSCGSLEELTPIVPQQTQTHKIEYMESSARVLEADHNLLSTPMIADLDVSAEKVTYTETEMFANLEVTRGLLSNIAELKKIALSRAARQYKADILVGSTIDVITNKDGRLEITVSGYPARYVKFRKASSQDIDLLKNIYNIRTVDGANVVRRKESRMTSLT